MKKDRKKIVMAGISGLVAAGLLVGSVEYASHMFSCTNADFVKAAEQVKQVSDEVRTSAASGLDKETVSKQETVYATMDANGGVTDVIVSDWLKNAGKETQVQDKSTLEDIINTKGDEEFTKDGDSLTWNTDGQDIYYQGKTQEELPVGMQITYELDGKTVTPEELAGRSGKLKMVIQYTNSSRQTVTIAGEETEVYTPFLMATGMILPVDRFTNLTIDNGSIVSEGDNDIVVAYGMPGLSESLKLDELDLGEDVDLDTGKLEDKMTDTVTITADVTDFEMKPSYTVATAELFNELDQEEIDDVDELQDKMDEMTDAAEELVDGSEKLDKNLNKLDSKFDDYADAISTLKKSTQTLRNGAKQLNQGTKAYTKGTDQLLNGVKTYVDGSKSLSKGVKSYTAGTKQLVTAIGKLNDATSGLPKKYETFGKGVNSFVTSVDTLLSEENMDKMVDGTSEMKDGIAKLDQGLQGAKTGVKEINKNVNKLAKTAELDQCVTALTGLKAQYKAMADAAATDAEKQQYLQLAAALEGAVQYIEGGETAAAKLDVLTNGTADGDADQNGAGDLAAVLSQLQAATATDSKEMNLYTGAAALSQSAETMSEYAGQLRANSGTLLGANSAIESGINELSKNVKAMYKAGNQLTANNSKLNSGADTLIKNAGTIKKNAKKLTSKSASLRKATKTMAIGTKKLAKGVVTLAGKTGDVSDAISKLADGAGDLSEGMVKFNKEAVKKLTGTVTDMTDGASDLQDRISAVSSAAKDYQSFSGTAANMEGSVKFVLSTAEIKEEE